MKKLLIICIMGILLTGCSKGVSQEVFNSLDNDYNSLQKEYDKLLLEHEKITEEKSEIEKKYSELNADFTNLENRLNDSDVYGVSCFKGIAFLMPTSWEVVNQDDIAYYYPEEGILMLRAVDLEIDTSGFGTSQHKEMLDMFFESLSNSSDEYKEIGAWYIDTKISSMAKEVSYYSDYNGVTHENKTFAFACKDTLYTFTFAQPDKITDIDIYDNIINSVIIVQ